MDHLQYTDLFRKISERNPDLQHSEDPDKATTFYRVNVFEFETSLKKFSKFPAMALEASSSQGKGNIDNLQELHTAAFTIWGKATKKHDAAEEDEVLSQCKGIVNDCFKMFLSDLEALIELGDTTTVISIDVESVKINKVGPYHGFYHGYRCQFSFTSKF